MRTSIEGARGCGYRKPGGYYLVAPELAEPCPRLPLELDRCPHCGQGIGPARGFTWITPAILFPANVHGGDMHSAVCPLGLIPPSDPATYHRTGDRAGLIWVGGQFYPTPESFMAEAATMGISRRIKALPRGFVIGEHWVYLGHRKAITRQYVGSDEVSSVLDAMPGGRPEGLEVMPQEAQVEYLPGVITLFKPTAVEYIVKGSETDEELEALEKRGITPVKVIRKEALERVGPLLMELGSDFAGNDELWREAFQLVEDLDLRTKAPTRVMVRSALSNFYLAQEGI
jgi:hypothetical protein